MLLLFTIDIEELLSCERNTLLDVMKWDLHDNCYLRFVKEYFYY